MKYNRFGSTGWDVSTVSLGILQESGAARGESGVSSECVSDALMRGAELGINCIDLGFPWLYSNGEKLAEELRKTVEGLENVRLNINIPIEGVSTAEELDAELERQLALWRLERAELCTIHGVKRSVIDTLKAIDIGRWARRAKTAGKIADLGLSFHDDAHYLEEILPLYEDWSFVRFKYSMVDYRHHPGVGGIEIAGRMGLGVIASEPTKSGRLLLSSSSRVEAAWDQARGDGGKLKCMLDWLYNEPMISTAQLEAENAEAVEEFVKTALTCSPGALDSFDLLWDNRVREAYYAERMFKCTSCRCCMPCPLGIDAPRIIELYHDSLMFGEKDIPAYFYRLEGHDKTVCIGCGECVASCPKHYPIKELLAKADESFAR